MLKLLVPTVAGSPPSPVVADVRAPEPAVSVGWAGDEAPGCDDVVESTVGDRDAEEAVVCDFGGGVLLGEDIIEGPESSYEIEEAVTNCTVKA